MRSISICALVTLLAALPAVGGEWTEDLFEDFRDFLDAGMTSVTISFK